MKQAAPLRLHADLLDSRPAEKAKSDDAATEAAEENPAHIAHRVVFLLGASVAPYKAMLESCDEMTERVDCLRSICYIENVNDKLWTLRFVRRS